MFKPKKKSRKKELADLLFTGELMRASELEQSRQAKAKLLEEFESAVSRQMEMNIGRRKIKLTGKPPP